MAGMMVTPFILIPALWAAPPAPPSPEYPKTSAHEMAVVKELSWARTAPREYAQFLRELWPFYEGKRFKRPNLSILTQRGGCSQIQFKSGLRLQGGRRIVSR